MNMSGYNFKSTVPQRHEYYILLSETTRTKLPSTTISHPQHLEHPKIVSKTVPVEHIMLQHEEDVKDETEQAKTELGHVPEERYPVVVVVRVEDHLEYG